MTQGIVTKLPLRPIVMITVPTIQCIAMALKASLQGPKLLGSAPTTVVLERAVRAKRTRTAASGTVIYP